MRPSDQGRNLQTSPWARAFLALGLLTAAALGGSKESFAQDEQRQPAAEEQLVIPQGIPSGNAERGRHLAHEVAMCVECHSPRDEEGRLFADTEFTGAPIPVGPPPWAGGDWALRAPRNRGLPGYSREIAVRLLVNGGVDREGRQLRAPMPRFRMTLQEAADVVEYLKSLP